MPRGFIFSLQPVLEQRQRIEDQRRLAVAELERERLRTEESLRAYQRAIAAAKRDLRVRLGAERSREEGSAPVSLADVRLQASESLSLVNKAQQAVIHLAGIHKQIDAARLSLLEATTQRKAVELLRTRRLEEWTQQQRRRESAELDELCVMRFARPHDESPGDAA
ncbi:MAG: flagellar export protein FliJ [Phycisphaerales bacterium]